MAAAAASSSAASASSSSSHPKWRYDVFLSFRGEDTRNTFTSHLYHSLDRVGIRTFIDDKRLEEGSTISVELCNAIEESQVAVIIFSKNYASSGWCLDELVKIMEFKNELGKMVIPIFYDVDPSTVRKQTASFARAFAKHESRFSQVDDVQGKHKLQGWKTALTDAAGVSGHDIRNRNEAEYIQKIVAQISKLCNPPSSSLKDVVGFNFHLEKVKPLLKIEINDVRIVGIWGMGGVGKTTIARAIFEMFSDQFKASCFLSDVKEKERRDGLHSLQNILLSKLLSKDFEKVDDQYEGERIMSSRLCSKKVLVVLDDIDHIDQLKYLARDCGWFGEGSRIIVTTRDRQLIGEDGVVYEVTMLPNHEAFQLFNHHAFKDKVPDRRFESLSWEVVNHAKGLPLALVVWGSFLRSKREMYQWESAVERMKDCSNSEIVEKLKISYDGLEEQEQKIFLDIACFFRGWRKGEFVPILESCGFHANIGLDVLIEKSLVFITDNNMIDMHDLIQDMGKHVVEFKKKWQGEYGRIWRKEDFERAMINNTGTEAVEAIQIYLQLRPNWKLSKKAMKNMNNLRYLQIHGWTPMTMIKYLPNSLCWLNLGYYPAESLPAKFEPKKLVHLRLKYSKLRRLWTGQKDLPKLRTLDLSWSEELEQTPDFTKMKNLEILSLIGCKSLIEVPQSLQYCRNLTVLELKNCRKLESLPEEIGDLENLQKLDASYTAISQPPPSIVRLNKLEHLNLSAQTSKLAFVFPRVNEGLRSLEVLDLAYCDLIDGGLPEDIRSLSSLQVLSLRGNHFEHLPQSIVSLIALRILNLGYCTKLKELPELPPNIVELHANYHLAKGSIQTLATKNMKLKLIMFTSLSGIVDDDESISDESNNDFPNDDPSYEEMNDLLAETLSGYMDALSASDSLPQRMITAIYHPGTIVPSLFDLQEMEQDDDYQCWFKLPKDWYVRGNFFGFVVCLVGTPYDCFPMDALTLLSDDDALTLLSDDNQSNHDELEPHSVALDLEYHEGIYHQGAYFLFVPFNSIWDASKANEKTPNDYGLLMLDIDGCVRKDPLIRGHLIYKKGVGTGKRRSGSYEAGESSSNVFV